MKRWIIHIHRIAKETNPSFAGEVREYYYGKGWRLLHSAFEPHLSAEELKPYFVRKYGFTNHTVAIAGLKSHMKHHDEYWDDTFELIELDVRE